MTWLEQMHTAGREAGRTLVGWMPWNWGKTETTQAIDRPANLNAAAPISRRSHHDPFDELFDRLFHDLSPWRRWGDLDGWYGDNWPHHHLHSDADGYELEVELPGVDPKQLELSVSGRQLTLRGQQQSDHHREAFCSSILLPGPVDSTGIHAQHRHGLLQIRLPKPVTAKARRIPITAG